MHTGLTHPYPRSVAGVPCLIAEPSSLSASRPVVLWCHGFRADALAHAAELEMCAGAGFLAVGIDAVAHGARIDPTLSRRIAESAGGAMPVMLECVEQTVRELPSLIDALADTYDIDKSRVSLVGISMGAFLAYRSVVAGVPLRAVVALLGSPEWPGETSAHRSPDAFRRVALLSITAQRDVSVPPSPAIRLDIQLGLSAQTADARPHHHYELRGAGHLTTADEWHRAMRVTQQWLQRMG